MKQISDDFAARLARTALTLCLCWKLTRLDGIVLGVTDHDQALTVDGLEFDPGAAIEAGQFIQSQDVRPGRAAGAGVLSNQGISEADLKDGAWDGCRVDVYRVDWRRPDLGKLHIWAGYFSEIEFTPAGKFEAQLVSLKSDLERPIGRLVQRQCDAVLGDDRCGISAQGRTCDQRWQTCKDVFDNADNFRGFPHLPGTDYVLSGPSNGSNDGGKR